MNGILLVNKPQGMTSHDVVSLVRRYTGNRKIGHTGTLDPMATGLMMLTCGNATKILPLISEHDKEYIATVILGYRTDTMDVTGETLETRPVNPFSENELQDALKQIMGKQLQVPPMYSAKKVNGKKLYELARKNIEVDRKPVEIEVYETTLIAFNESEITFRVRCSSGTYVRALCELLAEKLNNIGTMKSLVRTKIAGFSLDDSYTLDQIRDGQYELVSSYDVLRNYRYVEYPEMKDIYNGKPINLNYDDDIVIIVEDGKVVAAYRREEDGRYYCQRGLW